MGIVAAELVAKVTTAGIDTAQGQLLGMGAATDEAGAKFQHMASIGVALAGAAIVALGVKAATMAGDFQSSMVKLTTSAGESVSNLGMVSQGVLDMAVQTGTSTQQLADGLYMVESAGYHGSAGLEVLKNSAMGAKAEGADLATVTNAVTTVMNDFGLKSNQSSVAVNTLIATVANGKTTLQDLSASLSQVLPTASAVGVSLVDTSAAMATMTSEGVPAANAATYLRQTLISLTAPASAGKKALEDIGLSTGQVASEMKKSLPAALQDIMTHLAETYKVGSPQYIEALKNIAGGSKQMQGMLDLTGAHMATFQADVGKISGAVKQGGTSIMGWSEVQGTFNFKLAQAKEVAETFGIKIGTVLLPALSNLLGVIPNIVNYISNFQQHANVLVPILAGIGVVIAAVLVPAVWSLAAGVIAATWPLLLIAAAVAGVIAIFMHFYQTSTQFRAAVDGIASTVKNTLGGAFAFLQRQAAESTLKMKDEALGNTLQMKEGVVNQLMQQRDQVEMEMEHTRSAVSRHMLAMKLDAINQSLQQAQGVVKNVTKQRQDVEQQLMLMDPAAHLHMLKMKDDALNTTIAMKNGVIEHLKQMAQQVETEMRQTHDPAVRHMLQMKEQSIAASLQQAEGVVKNATKQRTGVESQMKQLSAQVQSDNSSLGARILGVWNGIQSGVSVAVNFVWKLLQQVGSFLASTFAPVWQQLVQVWNTSILPSLKQLWAALQPLLPVLQAIGGIIVAVVVVAFGILVGILRGGIQAFAALLSGVAQAIGGIVQFITGLVQVVSGVVKFIYDLLTGNFSALGSDLGTIWQGIVNMFQGVWKAISGIFSGVIGAIVGFVSGFVQGIVGFFQWLANTLVGHSIVPDMIAGIISFFASMPGKIFSFVSNLVLTVVSFFVSLASQVLAKVSAFITGVVTFFAGLPGKAMSAIGGLIGQLASFFGGLASRAVSWGVNIISNLASGIINSIGSFIGNAMGQVGNFISSHLPHSPAKMGPLMELPKQAQMISQQIAEGIVAGSPKIQAAMGRLMRPVSLSVGATGNLSGAIARTSIAGATGQGQTIIIQPPDLVMDGVKVSRTLLPHLHRALVYNT